MYDARPERGEKRICLHCEAKFYDMMRSPILCPKCGTEYVEVVRPPAPVRQPRRSAFSKDRPRPVEETEESGTPPSHAEAESEDEGWEDEERDADDEDEADAEDKEE